MEPSQHAIMERSRDLHRLDMSAVDGVYRTPPSSVAGSTSSKGSVRKRGHREDKRIKLSHRGLTDSERGDTREQQLAFEGHNYHGDSSRQNGGQMSGFPVGHLGNIEGETGYRAISNIVEHASHRHPAPPPWSPYRQTDVPPALTPYPKGDRARSAAELEKRSSTLSPQKGDISLYYSHTLSRTTSEGVGARQGGRSSALMIYGHRPDGGEKLPYRLDVEHSPRDRAFGEYPTPGSFVSSDKRFSGTQAEPTSGYLPPSYDAKGLGAVEASAEHWGLYDHPFAGSRDPPGRLWHSPQPPADTLTPSTASTDSTIMSQSKDVSPATPPLPRWSTGPSQDKVGESSSTVPRSAQRYPEPIQSMEMVSHPSGESIRTEYSDQYASRQIHLSPSSIAPTLPPRSHSDPNQSHRRHREERATTSGSPRDEADKRSDSGNEGGGSNKKRKRTRVLMTHVQQATLAKLWKTTKFPGTGEREVVARQVGLTGRQVQVWFQNRRQTFRKQIATNTIPEGSDPADYADLQASPRSRRLTLEASKAADRDRVTAWASSATVSGIGGSLGLVSDKGEDDSALSTVDETEHKWNEPRSAGVSSSFSIDREPRRGGSMWEMDEDERLPAVYEPDDRRSSHHISPRPTTKREAGLSNSHVRSSPSQDPWRTRPEHGQSSSSLSSSFPQSSRLAYPSYPTRDHSRSPLPQMPGASIDSAGTRSQLPPSLRALTLAGPTVSSTDRKSSSFGSLEAHHYDPGRASAGPSPRLPSHEDRGIPHRSSTDSLLRAKGPRDWFPSASTVDRKWLEGDRVNVASHMDQTGRSDTPRDTHTPHPRLDHIQAEAQHRHSEPSHPTSHQLPEIDHRAAKYARSYSESQPSDRDRRMSFERGEQRHHPIDAIVDQRVARADLPRFKDIFR